MGSGRSADPPEPEPRPDVSRKGHGRNGLETFLREHFMQVLRGGPLLQKGRQGSWVVKRRNGRCHAVGERDRLPASAEAEMAADRNDVRKHKQKQNVQSTSEGPQRPSKARCFQGGRELSITKKNIYPAIAIKAGSGTDRSPGAHMRSGTPGSNTAIGNISPRGAGAILQSTGVQRAPTVRRSTAEGAPGARHP